MDNKTLIKNYRPNVGVALFNRDGRVWYGRRYFGFSDLGDGPDNYR